jgi:hypothetical protein
MRVLVCGGRDFANINPHKKDDLSLSQYRFVRSVLANFTNRFSKEWSLWDNWLPTDITIISGAAKGVDSAAIDYAISDFLPFEEYPADWDQYGKGAGYIRNQQMLDTGIDLVVAFPGGRGTADMVRRAKKAGVEVLEVYYDCTQAN